MCPWEDWDIWAWGPEVAVDWAFADILLRSRNARKSTSVRKLSITQA